jgi:hypothetical protein
MAIANFPLVLQPIIQQGFLEREFETGLRATLGFRDIATREIVAVGRGETVTKTKPGLLPLADQPIDPATNTNFDNGLPKVQYGVEQYTLSMDRYGTTMDLNTVDERVGIVGRFLTNANRLGESAIRTLDTLARNAMFGTYLGGTSFVKTTNGAAGTVVKADNVLGFVPGVVTVGANAYTLVGVTRDAVNVSTVPGGRSGSMVFSTNVSVADATSGQPMVAATAPIVLRANGRTSTAALQTGDTLTMLGCLLDAAAILRDNAVPTIGGFYHAYMDNMTMKGLFADEDFKLLFRGAYGSDTYKTGMVVEILGLKLIPTNNTVQQNLNGLQIRRTLVCGEGALIEGRFAGQDAADTDRPLGEISHVDGVTMVTREPMDRLQEIIAQSWKWIGGYTVPTDLTANSSVIPTASNSAYKRAIVIESL